MRHQMAHPDRSLLSIAAAAGAGGALATALTLGDSTLTGALGARWYTAFAESPWSMLPASVSVLGGIAAVATVADLVARRVKPAQSSFGRLEGKGQQEIVKS